MKVKDEQPFHSGFLEIASLLIPDTKKQVPPDSSYVDSFLL